MSALAFVDTETTSLLPSRRAWEFACIRREEDGREERLEMFISAPLDEADPMSLRFAKFYERHPDYRLSEPDAIGGWDEQTAARFIERITRSAVLVGSNPAFDAATLAPLLRRHALIESWHYAVRDISFAAVELVPFGFLRVRAAAEYNLPIPNCSGWGSSSDHREFQW